jgi:general stress protein 26
MAGTDYEDLTGCGLTDELEEQLLQTMRNCVFSWVNKQGEPFGVVMSYLPKDGKLWLTAAERRKRIASLRRDPRASVVVWGAGSALGSGQTVSYKGTCVVHTDRDTKDWFYPEFTHHLRGDTPARKVFEEFLDSPDRVIIEFTPTYRLSFDSELMWSRSPGADA